MNEMMTAWAAGLFEGEGSIVIRKDRGYVLLTLRMTDRDVVDKFCEWANCGNVHCFENKGLGTKLVYSWDIAKREHVFRVLTDLLPYLGERRSKRVLEALAKIGELPDQTLCKNQRHKIQEVGTAKAGKYNICLGCKKERDKRGKQRQKEKTKCL